MNRWIVPLALAALLFGSLCACKKRAQKEYETALSKGVVLLSGDTVAAKVGDRLLFPYQFADGVYPGWYTYEIINSDTQTVRYINNATFHFAEKGEDGGPAAGILIFSTHEAGLVELLFYKPYVNQMYYEGDDLVSYYKGWLTLAEHLGTPDTAFTEAVFDNWYQTYREADSPDQTRLWSVLYAAAGPTRPTGSIDRTPELFAKMLPLMNTDDPEWSFEIMDSMVTHYYGSLAPHILERWAAFQENPPIHPNLHIDSCYVRLR